MIKKVPVSELRLGMFVHDLNIGWMAHAFLRTRFMLKRAEDLRTILESGVSEVYIDTVKGLDLAGAPTEEEAEAAVFREMIQEASALESPVQHTTFREELTMARRIHMEATQLVTDLFQDVRSGRPMQVERAEPMVEGLTASLLRNPGVMLSLCRLKERDAYTFQHSVSVSALMVLFSAGLELPRETYLQVGMAGLLHDTGKMTIPDEILNKPSKLTDAEYEVMKRHVMAGNAILEATPGIGEMALKVATQHHERVAGTGYPGSLIGRSISPEGRMAAIADVYDAITSDRVYHRGLPPSQALAKMFEWSREHFDRKLMHRFIRTLGVFPAGSLVRLDSQCLAVVVEQGESDLLAPTVRAFYDIPRAAFISPRDIDLSTPESGGDAILSWEDPAEWDVDPMAILFGN